MYSGRPCWLHIQTREYNYYSYSGFSAKWLAEILSGIAYLLANTAKMQNTTLDKTN